MWSTTEEVKNVNHTVCNINVQIKLGVIAKFQYWILNCLAVSDCAVNSVKQPLVDHKEVFWRRWLVMFSPFSGDSTGGLCLALAEVHVTPSSCPSLGSRTLKLGELSHPQGSCPVFAFLCMLCPCKAQHHYIFVGKRPLWIEKGTKRIEVEDQKFWCAVPGAQGSVAGLAKPRQQYRVCSYHVPAPVVVIVLLTCLFCGASHLLVDSHFSCDLLQ